MGCGQGELCSRALIALAGQFLVCCGCLSLNFQLYLASKARLQAKSALWLQYSKR